MYLGLTMALGAGFLGVKAIEYTTEYREHLVPGWDFRIPEERHGSAGESDRDIIAREQLNPGRYEMFFVLYFFMTGLHAIHLIIGIGLVGIMAYLSYHRWFSGGGATQIEVTGLYWHFIDIVWVFLYPMLYLINVHQ
jgi:cytochrome c oxidase subunit 3